VSLIPIADHGLVVAIPFVIPMLVIVLGIVALALRDRAREGDRTGR
jgi:hypothetical protein